MATSNSVKKPNVIAQRWEAMEPARKKQVALAGGLAVVMAGAFMVVSGSDASPEEKRASAQGKIQNALMPEEGGRDLGVAGVNQQSRKTQSDVRRLEGELKRLQSQLEREQQSRGAGSTEERLIGELATLRTELSAVQRQQQLQANQAAAAATRPGGVAGRPVQVDPNAPAPAPAFGGIRSVNQAPVEAPPQPGVPSQPSPGQPASVPTSNVTPEAGVNNVRSAADGMYLHSGAILTGVLLSGVDAPSGKKAIKDPVPVLARIKHDAILANRFKADVKECFMLLETVGNMASERAMMRAISLSCVRRDKSIVETNISGFAVGEDGRAGLKGVVTTHHSAVLRKATIAGFLESFSQAFGGSRSISIGAGGISSEALESGATSGTGSALGKISEWYLDQADELTPTVSIGAGRQITIVLTKGRDLTPGAANAAERVASAPSGNAVPVRN